MTSTTKSGEDELTIIQKMWSAYSGSLLTSFFVTPFDVIKTRLQATSGTQKCLQYCNCAVEDLCYQIYGRHKHGQNCFLTPKERFNSTAQVMYRIIRMEGPRSLWSGLTPTLAMSAPSTMIYYPTYEYIRDRFQKKSNSDAIPAVAGALSRSVAVVIVSPLDLIRTKMQSRHMSSKELTTSIRTSLRHEGFRSMYIGLVPTLYRDVPFSMVYWCLYEKFRRHLDIESLFAKSFVSGITSGAVAAILTQPFDVIKTKRQIMLGGTELFGAQAHHTSLTFITKDIMKHSGVRGYFVGLAPRLLKVAPACAIMITSYELSKQLFHNYNREK